ncbi:MAG: acyl carrier protein [Nannocystaceae bacterium]|nr:acyl carrier protein [Nannocystaceae bacterium]
MNTELEAELKQLIVEALMLDDVGPEGIDVEAPLFGEGLGLDSIDALELAISIERRFGLKIQPSEEAGPKIFASVRVLAQYVDSHRPPQ